MFLVLLCLWYASFICLIDLICLHVLVLCFFIADVLLILSWLLPLAFYNVLALILLLKIVFLWYLKIFLSGNSAGSKPVNPGSLTILDLHLTMLPFKTMSLFSDKKEAQRSSSALGYVAHVRSFSLLIKLSLMHFFHFPLY